MNHTPGRHDPASDLNLNDFRCWLTQRNRAENTILAYTYAVQQFFSLYQQPDSPSLRQYKCFLLEHYKPRTVNQRIRALNCYMEYINCPEAPVAMLRMQQNTYVENVISQADYEYLKQCLVRDGNYLYYFLIL